MEKKQINQMLKLLRKIRRKRERLETMKDFLMQKEINNKKTQRQTERINRKALEVLQLETEFKQITRTLTI